MKFIRAILRHSLLLAIVIGSGVAYYYRDDWLPQFYEKVADLRTVSEKYFPDRKGAEEMSLPAEAAAPVPVDKPVRTEPIPEAADVAGQESRPGPDRGVESAVEPLLPPVAQAPVAPAPPAAAPDLSRYRPLDEDETADDAGESAPETAASGSEIVPEAAEPGESAADETAAEEAASDTAAQAVGAPQADATAEVPAPVTPPPPEQVALAEEQPMAGSSDTREQLRADARSAFWRHDYQQAERDYKALAELDPSDPDAWGELGNVYFSQGKWNLAADAFYEAGVRLVQRGEGQRARNLLVIIRGLNPEKGTQLEQQLDQAQGGSGN